MRKKKAGNDRGTKKEKKERNYLEKNGCDPVLSLILGGRKAWVGKEPGVGSFRRVIIYFVPETFPRGNAAR